MQVAEIMTRELLTVAAATSVRDALARAQDREVHHVLVVEQKRLRGVLCVCELRERAPDASLAQSITRAPEVIWAESTLKQAARRFVEKGVSCLPVCDGATLVGVLTRGDLRRSVISEAELPHSFRCGFCGSTRHVRPLPGAGLGICLDCQDRSAPAQLDLYDEGDKD